MSNTHQSGLPLVGIAPKEQQLEPLKAQKQCPPYAKYFLK